MSCDVDVDIEEIAQRVTEKKKIHTSNKTNR